MTNKLFILFFFFTTPLTSKNPILEKISQYKESHDYVTRCIDQTFKLKSTQAPKWPYRQPKTLRDIYLKAQNSSNYFWSQGSLQELQLNMALGDGFIYGAIIAFLYRSTKPFLHTNKKMKHQYKKWCAISAAIIGLFLWTEYQQITLEPLPYLHVDTDNIIHSQKIDTFNLAASLAHFCLSSISATLSFVGTNYTIKRMGELILKKHNSDN